MPKYQIDKSTNRQIDKSIVIPSDPQRLYDVVAGSRLLLVALF
jgi:hypothetical protein